jgi:hypothetical protein
MDFDLDMDAEIEKLKRKKLLFQEFKQKEQEIIDDYKTKCEIIDQKVRELQSLKGGKYRIEYKQALIDLRTKYEVNELYGDDRRKY